MRWKSAILVSCALATLAGTGCTRQARIDLHTQTGGSAALFHQYRAYDARTGRALSFPALINRCRSADVVLFGEMHGNSVCNQLEAQLVHGLLAGPRPVALAMEFFEADTQAAVDAYLSNKLDEATFQDLARSGRRYPTSHRPLIEMCRAAGVPVLAANTPRRLVREYRKSGMPYPAYRASVSAEDQRWLPATSEMLTGPYSDRFEAMMTSHEDAVPTEEEETADDSAPTTQPGRGTGAESGPADAGTADERATHGHGAMPPVSQPGHGNVEEPTWKKFYRAQLLWDDAMAETIANYRARHASDRVMLIVGAFHVAEDGGTVAKLRQRRPGDRVLTVVFVPSATGEFELDREDRALGDIVIYGITPPEPDEDAMPEMLAKMPPMGEAPTSAPAGEMEPSHPMTSDPAMEHPAREHPPAEHPAMDETHSEHPAPAHPSPAHPVPEDPTPADSPAPADSPQMPPATHGV